MGDLQHRGKQVRLGGEQMPQGDRKRDHPLAHRHVRDDLLHQMGRGLGHPASPTRRAKPSPFAGEGREFKFFDHT